MTMTFSNPNPERLGRGVPPPVTELPVLPELPDLGNLLAQANAVREAAVRDRDEAQTRIDRADAYIAALGGKPAEDPRKTNSAGKPWSHAISDPSLYLVLKALGQRQHKIDAERLAHDIGLSRSTVGRAFRVLDERGHVDIVMISRRANAKITDAGRVWLAERQREAGS